MQVLRESEWTTEGQESCARITSVFEMGGGKRKERNESRTWDTLDKIRGRGVAWPECQGMHDPHGKFVEARLVAP